MKRFISMMLSLIIIFTCGACGGKMLVPSARAYGVQYNEVKYTYDDIDTLIELIAEQISNMDTAHQMAEAARELGYEDDHDVIQIAKNEYDKADKMSKEYRQIYNNLVDHWHQKEEEYPIAAYIWSYLKNLGYNNQVCAGILGNIMAEVGGNTLNIQYWLQSSGYYGICQWSRQYHPRAYECVTIEEQCNYLQSTIKEQIDAFGWCYQSGYDYNMFCRITNPSNAALCFAKAYERCGSCSYRIRQKNAEIAYSYFVS